MKHAAFLQQNPVSRLCKPISELQKKDAPARLLHFCSKRAGAFYAETGKKSHKSLIF